MKGKEITKIARKLLALVFVFSLLQSHLVILNEFAGTAYAAIESSIDEKSKVSSTVEDESEFEEDLDEDKSFENQIETDPKNEIEYEQTVENVVDEITNTVVRDETADDFNQSDDIVVENTTIDSDGDATGDDESDDEDVAEIICQNTYICIPGAAASGINLIFFIKIHISSCKILQFDVY